MRTEQRLLTKKALVEEEPSDNDLAEEELLSQGATQRVLDCDSALPWGDWFAPHC